LKFKAMLLRHINCRFIIIIIIPPTTNISQFTSTFNLLITIHEAFLSVLKFMAWQQRDKKCIVNKSSHYNLQPDEYAVSNTKQKCWKRGEM